MQLIINLLNVVEFLFTAAAAATLSRSVSKEILLLEFSKKIPPADNTPIVSSLPCHTAKFYSLNSPM